MNQPVPSPYDQRVESILRAAEARRESFTVQGRELDLQDIPFPPLLHYGFEHANVVMLMAPYVAQTLGVGKKEVIDAIKFAALFHDTGRLAPWRETDAEHRFRSVEIWRVWANQKAIETSVKEEVAWLIANHTLSRAEGHAGARATRASPPIDHRLIGLWDAECLEAARFAPNTGEGLRILNQRLAQLISPFAKNVAKEKTQRDAWLRYRGWKK